MAFEASVDTHVAEQAPEAASPKTETPSVTAPAQPVTAEGLARDARVMASRVTSILNVAQKKIDAHEQVREGLPDFDKPAESAKPPTAPRDRALIDDTEIVDTGRDPAKLFAEAERKAKVVNGHAKRVGPISGRVLVMAPWVFVLVLSMLGFGIGAVEAMKPAAGLESDAPRLAGTILAVFGIMMVMSVYYIFWKRHSDES